MFVDRYYLHYSQRPENAYIGTLLQLGLIGLALLLAALVALVLRIRLVRDAAAAACAGAVVCGLVLAVSQSYLTSVGSPAMVPFWFAALLLVGATEPQAAYRLGDRQGREREIEASQRNAEPRLDVVRSEQERVDGEEDDDASGRRRLVRTASTDPTSTSASNSQSSEVRTASAAPPGWYQSLCAVQRNHMR